MKGMETKEIKVLVSWTGENINGGIGDPELGAILVTATTLEDFKKEFEESFEFHLEGLRASGEQIPDYILAGDYHIVYDLEAISSFLPSTHN